MTEIISVVPNNSGHDDIFIRYIMVSSIFS